MEWPECKQFYQEFIGAVTAFFNDSPNEMHRIIRDLLYSLRNTVDVLSAHNNDWDNPLRSQCIASLDSLCINLHDARIFCMLVQRLKSLDGDENKARRAEILEVLRAMLDLCHENQLHEVAE